MYCAARAFFPLAFLPHLYTSLFSPLPPLTPLPPLSPLSPSPPFPPLFPPSLLPSVPPQIQIVLLFILLLAIGIGIFIPVEAKQSISGTDVDLKGYIFYSGRLYIGPTCTHTMYICSYICKIYTSCAMGDKFFL